MTQSAGGESYLELLAPLAGWVLPLAKVPDPVFAAAMAGDGLAIDPTGEILHAPCDGLVSLLGANRHALTIKAGGADVLMHVGIDTMKLKASGFKLLVRDGERVRAGQPLLEFDLDAIVRNAPSAITPVLITGALARDIERRGGERRVAVGDFLFTLQRSGAAPATERLEASAKLKRFRVPFEHGLHARPAAQLAAALANIDAEVMLRIRGRDANARSVVAVMALGVSRGEIVSAAARGREADAALRALGGVLELAADTGPALRNVTSAVTVLPPKAGTSVRGLVAVQGLAIGRAAPLEDSEPAIGPALGDPASELVRLTGALGAVASSLQRVREASEGVRKGLLDAHVALLSDPQLRHDADASIAAGASAAQAWQDALRSAAEPLRALSDPRMAERRADLLDIERQVLRVLAGAPPVNDTALPEHAIVLADELLPSQLLALEPARVAGICMAAGGATSHVAILAGSMGLPTLVAAGPSVLAIAPGTPLVLNADEGVLLVDPPEPERRRVDALVLDREGTRARDAAVAHLPARMTDGTEVRVYCNLGTAAEAEAAVYAGAEGCGLLRSEFLFLSRSHAPDEDEQLAQYQAICNALAGRPLTVRTLDAGGDKPIGYLVLPQEVNPALGLRGLRTGLSRPDLMETQLRALARVEPAGRCRVLLPMVTDLDDLRAVRAQLTSACEALNRPAPAVGVMIETPAAALLADQLAGECEFLSIGSNDLAQYTLAMDRLHPTLSMRLDGVHPAVLRLIERAASAGAARKIETAVCGNLAADPEAVPLLIGLGIRELSVVPAQIPRLKSQLRKLDSAECADLARRALNLANAQQVRGLVREWGMRNG